MFSAQYQTLHVYTRYTCIYTVMLASNTYTYIHGQNKVDDMIFMVNYGRGHVKKMASVWRCSHLCSLSPVLQAIKCHLPHPHQDNCSPATNNTSLEPPIKKVRLLDFCSVSDDSRPMKKTWTLKRNYKHTLINHI